MSQHRVTPENEAIEAQLDEVDGLEFTFELPSE